MGDTHSVVLSLYANSNNSALSGTLVRNAVNGQATFDDLAIGNAGAGYQLTAVSDGLSPTSSSSFSVVPLLQTSVFNPPPANACQSNYDQFYGSEPGVFAYWALCEKGSNPDGSNPIVYDYVGKYDLAPSNSAWREGIIIGGVAGPVSDGETSLQAPTATSFMEAQNMILNATQGTVSTWINVDLQPTPVVAVFLGAVQGSSYIAVQTNSTSGSACFNGVLENSRGQTFSTAPACGFAANTWHRVTLTWSAGRLMFYVDGRVSGAVSYKGTIDNSVYYYRLFPNCCDTAKQMTLAKTSVANQAWTAAQVGADFSPSITSPPAGGLTVTNNILGTIHSDVLGYSDNNANLSSSALISPLLSGLGRGGVTSLRYGGGYVGIDADLANWQGGPSCTSTKQVTKDAANVVTNNNLDSYMQNVAGPLNLHVGYTVNYGTNPPACNAGGDPVVNGANLVDYANNIKHYGIRYWEIGNEQYAAGNSETDFHPNPAKGASYATYESAFYQKMKAKDPTILVGIPVADTTYSWLQDWSLPAMAAASYDAIIWHNYPMKDPISDGFTLYQDRVASTLYRTHGSLLALQTALMSYGKSPDSIWVTEWDGDVSGNLWSRQSMGAVMPMFATIQLAEYMQVGVRYATWHTQGSGSACYQYNYDWSAENAYNWWDCGATFLTYAGPLPGEIKIGLKPGDISPPAHAFEVLSKSGFVVEGEHMLRTIADVKNAPWLLGYAASHGSSYAVILINRDRDNSHTVPVTLPGVLSGNSVEHWTYGRAQYDQSYFGNWSVGPVHSTEGKWTGSYKTMLPPWSVTVLIFTR